ncbi:hypothetical protein [Bacillus niameyensis]|uniref:hypothetical protein n=1 Tax=Bacillus niameyensis TaxID=1522308 RepID=UPI0007836438|nr:hypothetical protein [Bacillus niameyensis]
MKTPIYSMVLSLVTLALMGWALGAMYDVYVQFAEIIKDPTPPWEINFYVLPIFVFLIYSLIMFFLYRRKKKKGEKISIWLFPLQFSERDEREREISGEACRKAFISCWISAPIVAGLLAFYPLFEEHFHYFPILVVLIIPVIQIIAYFVNIRKI